VGNVKRRKGRNIFIVLLVVFGWGGVGGGGGGGVGGGGFFGESERMCTDRRPLNRKGRLKKKQRAIKPGRGNKGAEHVSQPKNARRLPGPSAGKKKETRPDTATNSGGKEASAPGRRGGDARLGGSAKSAEAAEKAWIHCQRGGEKGEISCQRHGKKLSSGSPSSGPRKAFPQGGDSHPGCVVGGHIAEIQETHRGRLGKKEKKSRNRRRGGKEPSPIIDMRGTVGGECLKRFPRR